MDIGLFVVVLAVAVFLQGRRIDRLEQARTLSRELEERLARAEKRLYTLAAVVKRWEMTASRPPEFHAPKPCPPEAAAPPAPPVSPVAPVQPAESATPVPRRFGLWKTLERQILENWTGILGSVILVAGITFLGIYSALAVPPVLRSLMLAAAAAALLAAGRWLLRREGWQRLGQWAHSMAAALFLLACVGSAIIPGLMWVTDGATVLGLLLLGLAANLAVAHATTSQSIGSLHVLLSLIPLAIVPLGLLSFGLGTLVTLHGVFLATRGRWDRHLLATLTAYALFHAAWHLQAEPGMAGLDLAGRLGLLSVSLAAGLVHYRKDYASPAFQLLPFLVHVGNWALLGASLTFFYPSPLPVRSLALLAAALAAFLLARRAKRLQISWLFVTDTLVAQGLAMAVILYFLPSRTDWPVVLFVLLLQTILFWRVVIDEAPLLAGIAMQLVHGAVALLGLGGLLRWLGMASAEPLRDGPLFLIAALVTALAGRYRDRAAGPAPPSPPPGWRTCHLGILAGPLAAVGLLHLALSPWLGLVALGVLGAMAALARPSATTGAAWGVWLGAATAHVLVWLPLLLRADLAPARQWGLWLPLLALMGLMFALLRQHGLPLFRATVALAGLHLAVGAFAMTVTLSNLAPPVLWLSLSLAALEAGHRLRGGERGALFGLGGFYLLLFAVVHVVFVLPAGVYLGSLPARLWIELFALAVLLRWWRAGCAETDGEGAGAAVPGHAWFLEFGLLFLVLTVLVEAAPPWRPVLWSLLAVAMLWAPADSPHTARLRLHALWFFWGAVINLVAVTSIFQTPSPFWHDQPAFSGSLALALLIGFLYLSKSRLQLADLPLPPGFERLSRLGGRLDRHRMQGIHYPFFFGVALFLFWRFDAMILTLLWFLETFVLFVLSIVLREPPFRAVALAGMAVCLVRLVFYDLTQADTLTRGLVFLGGGGLMLAINMLFNRFKERMS